MLREIRDLIWSIKFFFFYKLSCKDVNGDCFHIRLRNLNQKLVWHRKTEKDLKNADSGFGPLSERRIRLSGHPWRRIIRQLIQSLPRIRPGLNSTNIILTNFASKITKLKRSSKMLMKLTTGRNSTNISPKRLHAQIPKAQKKNDSLTYFCAFWDLHA